MPKAYLTIDDSPTAETEDLVDFLTARGIPAILFVRGELLEKNPRAIEYAIQKGFIVGNHSYAHKPAGEMKYQDWVDDLELCESLIEAAYLNCNLPRPKKLYRFPYIDRGDGQKNEQIDMATIKENDQTLPLQEYLHKHGFEQPFENMPSTCPNKAKDCLYTFTTRDWMLNNKHRGHHNIKTIDDLKARVDADKSLQEKTHNHVIIMHDQLGLFDISCALIDYLSEKGFIFQD